MKSFFTKKGNNNSSLCHFDGSDLEGGVEAMIASLKNLNKNKSETTYSLFIVGGFDDNRKLSLDLTMKLFGNRLIRVLNLSGSQVYSSEFNRFASRF